MKRNDSINGPGFWNVDASLMKRLRFGDRVSAELRADAFNLINTPHFNNPNGSLRRARRSARSTARTASGSSASARG